MWHLDVFRDPAGGYAWRMWGHSGRRVVRAAEACSARCTAELSALRFRDAAHALEYETYRGEDGAVRWRAVTEDGRALAESADAYADEPGAQEAARLVCLWAGTARFATS